MFNIRLDTDEQRISKLEGKLKMYKNYNRDVWKILRREYEMCGT